MSEWELGDDPDSWPTVSVIMPIRNETENLERAVEAVLAQEYPRPFDVCLAVAPSEDDTDRIATRLAAVNRRVSVVENPAGVTPAGLNAAIRATSGEVVVRVDGHSELSIGYVRRAVETMRRTGAVNVGGVQHAVGTSRFEEAVAVAMSSWIGTGGSRFHVGGAEGPVDTVYLGVFRRAALESAGHFDERLVRNQDYELNIRLRDAGGIIWFDPELSVHYRPRGSIGALARQYYEYGWWKAEVASLHPSSWRLRQVLPPVVVGTFVVAVCMVKWSRPARLVSAAYAATVGGTAALHRSSWLAAIYPTIHASWSVGLVSGLIEARRRRRSARVPRRGSARSAGEEVRSDASRLR